MARDNTIVLSDTEIDALRSARQEIFGSDEVPYGVVVEHLAEAYGVDA